MVDVGGKEVTTRRAVARGSVRMAAATLEKIEASTVAKGDVLATARLAGIMAAKRTAELIPLCHPLPITSVAVDLAPDRGNAALEIAATVACTGRTGVEMEALTAVSVAALTVYDMCKAIDRSMTIGRYPAGREIGRPLRRLVARRPRFFMIPVAEARSRIVGRFAPLPAEIVPLSAAAGRVLARDMPSRLTQPPLAVSAMDGYAVRAADTQAPGARLRPIGEAPAGTPFDGEIGPGETVRIFTGGPVPAGADAILIQGKRRTVGRCRHRSRTGRRGPLYPPGRARFFGRRDSAAGGPGAPAAGYRPRRRSERTVAAGGAQAGRGDSGDRRRDRPARRPGRARPDRQFEQLGACRFCRAERRCRAKPRHRRRRPGSAPGRGPGHGPGRPAGHDRRRLGRRARPDPAGPRGNRPQGRFLEDRHAAGQAADFRRARAGRGHDAVSSACPATRSRRWSAP